MKTFRSDVSDKEFPASEKVSARLIRHSIISLIQRDNPGFTHESFLSTGELNDYRAKYISEMLTRELGELTQLEQTVLASLNGNTTITDKIEDDDRQLLTTGQKISDKVASFGGSWKFLILFGIFMLIWITVNAFWLANKGFDPYPFILLNLLLSCVAAIQAPVIMMSQNRQEDKDRARGKKDYMINLKSELEIRTLHEKVDHFIQDQQQELLDIQKIQLEMMDELLREVRKPGV
jgi:uncharacterized membrane protein